MLSLDHSPIPTTPLRNSPHHVLLLDHSPSYATQPLHSPSHVLPLDRSPSYATPPLHSPSNVLPLDHPPSYTMLPLPLASPPHWTTTTAPVTPRLNAIHDAFNKATTSAAPAISRSTYYSTHSAALPTNSSLQLGLDERQSR
ncbi:hypothetical protein Pcinc_013309 [Petrolisthes cinctipes]|uniref:Uncharacterized protein n=1 Tax=Petrolisthes cinctipes TaxID=88211 RepID=A0AAE1G2X0_PETCI|nr:hypothetical protein Pcinc_013309 [Petrolisthes cinctipes]